MVDFPMVLNCVAGPYQIWLAFENRELQILPQIHVPSPRMQWKRNQRPLDQPNGNNEPWFKVVNIPKLWAALCIYIYIYV